MSSTGIPSRTEIAPTRPRISTASVATALSALLFSIAIISFRPFQPAGAATEGAPSAGGDILNQLGFGGLGAVALVSMLCFVRPRLLSALFSPWWLMMLVFLAFSVLNAGDPSSAARAGAFSCIAIMTICAVLVLPPDADSFSTALAAMAFAVLGLCYIGLVALPGIAIHSADSMEPQHAGLWRGLFSHKNIAAPVMACLSFAGFYLFRRGWKWIGTAIFLGAMIFISNAGSKTTAGLVPLAILIVALPSLMGLRRMTILLFLLAIIATAIGTLGMVFIEPVKQLAADYFPGLTYSGRTALWEFAGEMLARRPWIGYGFESFWGTELLSNTDQPFDREWDIRTIVHGHNGYLDLAVFMGIPALLVAIVTFILEPARDFMRIPHNKENVYLGDFFMMVLLFTLLNAFLESFFFRRADPVWLFVVLSVFGLRLAARFPIRGDQR